MRTESYDLGRWQETVDRAVADLAGVAGRVWDHDHTVWRPDPAEIDNRLGWLDLPQSMMSRLDEVAGVIADVQGAGYTQALLLGMGGSSLAPEVFRAVFGVAPGFLDLSVLDSTTPGAVLAAARSLDPARSLFIVSTKSGGTVETFSFFRYFFNWVADSVGREHAGDHFIAITDPGSGLADVADRYRFRHTFLNDPNIGGRYSALSLFGIVPAMLIGADARRLLESAQGAAEESRADDSPALRLGATMGALAKAGRDKLTFIAHPHLAPIGPWIEQLIAESTGKEGTGILPVAGEAVEGPEAYADDRLFVALERDGSTGQNALLHALIQAGHPAVAINTDDRYDLGGELFRWEFATAIAGRVLGIQPFDQPNVESAKVVAREMVAAYHESGALPEPEPTVVDGPVRVYGDASGMSAAATLHDVLDHAWLDIPGRSYVALQAYLPPDEETTAALQRLRTAIQTKHQLATTVGYGPRFLHSTGQLHKGDAGHGLFIQFTAPDAEDAPIPDEADGPTSSMTFGILKLAQVLGDAQALRDNGRKVLRYDLGLDPIAALDHLTDAVARS